jgi:predicted MFS family arabinose efflux permease
MTHAAQGSTRTSELRTLLSAAGLLFVFDVPINIAPILTGAMIDRLGLNSTEAGVVAGLEVLGMALPSVLLPQLTGRVAARTLALCGVVAFVIANGLSIFANTFVVLAPLRLASGLGAGLALMASTAMLARALRVERAAAYGAAIVAALIAGTVLAATVALRTYGLQGLFGFVALCGVAALPAALAAAPTPGPLDAMPVGLGRVLRSPLLYVMVSMMIGATAVWTFSERIGIGLGMSHEAVAGVIGATALVGVVGGVAAALASRFGRPWIFAFVSVACFGLSCMWLPLASDSGSFIAGMMVLTFFFVFTRPFITGLAVQKDPTGGLAAAVFGGATLVSAAAPILAGWLVSDGQLSNLFFAPAVATPLALLALLLVRGTIRQPTKAA